MRQQKNVARNHGNAQSIFIDEQASLAAIKITADFRGTN
jgi:hypothetical protein